MRIIIIRTRSGRRRKFIVLNKDGKKNSEKTKEKFCFVVRPQTPRVSSPILIGRRHHR